MRQINKNVRKRLYFLYTSMTAFMFLLTGCMYSGGGSEKSIVNSYEGSISRIQTAVDSFQESKGILPMITADQEVPVYEKFRVDLSKLEHEGYLDEIPKAAFEKGGSVYFLIQNEEVDPIVKVMDLVTVQKVAHVQRLVDSYHASHGTWPMKEEIYPNLYIVNTEAIQSSGNRVDELKSVYTSETLPYIMDSNGKVYADYAFDIMQLIEKKEIKPQDRQDLRIYLTEESYFVPVKSLPYTWDGSQPIAVPSISKAS